MRPTAALAPIVICLLGAGDAPRPAAPAGPSNAGPALRHRGLFHGADGILASDLTLPKGSSFTAALEFPEARKLGLGKTWACWIFPEDTWAVGGNSEIELFVDDAFVTRFAVAQGEWKVLIQSLAEHITDRVPDPTKAYRLRLRNAGDREVHIRELWIRWLAHPTATSAPAASSLGPGK
jgi:hypothetical protein